MMASVLQHHSLSRDPQPPTSLCITNIVQLVAYFNALLGSTPVDVLNAYIRLRTVVAPQYQRNMRPVIPNDDKVSKLLKERSL